LGAETVSQKNGPSDNNAFRIECWIALGLFLLSGSTKLSIGAIEVGPDVGMMEPNFFVCGNVPKENRSAHGYSIRGKSWT
jgi:hypothetical protein